MPPERKNRAWFLAAVGVAVLIFARHPVVFTRPEFWAEDGINLFAEAFTLGARSLFAPLTGYFHLAARLIAGLSVKFVPVAFVPHAFALAAGATAVGVFSYFARPGFHALLPSTAARTLVCWLIASGPGTAEIVGNLCTLHFLLGLWAILLLLEEPPLPDRVRVPLLLGVFLSSADCVLLLPLAAYRAVRRRGRADFLILAMLAAVTILNAITNAHYLAGSPRGQFSLRELVPLVADYFFTRFFLAPFFHENWLSGLLTGPAWFFWGAAVATVGIAAYGIGRRARREHWTVVTIVALSACGTSCLVALFRPEYVEGFRHTIGKFFLEGRYALLPAAWAILGWSVLLWRPRGKNWTVAILLALALVQNVLHWRNTMLRPNLDWPTTARAVRRQLEVRPTTVGPIRVQPNGYTSFSFRIP